VQVLKKLALATAVLSAAALPAALTAPASAAVSAPASATAAPAAVAYHNYSSSASAAKARSLMKQGYRPISFSVSNAANPRYAGVWVKDPGSQFAIYQDMSASGYQRRFNALRAKGFGPAVVSATGPARHPVFAAIWEKKSGKWMARHGLTPDEFRRLNRSADRDGYILTSVDAYGTPGDLRYAAVWSADSAGLSWTCTYGKTSSQNKREFDARLARGYRPTDIAVEPGGTYTTVWVKDHTPFYAYQGMSASGYQNRFDKLNAKGYFPVQVDAEDGAYSGVWEKR
jgi:hypothetical protein